MRKREFIILTAAVFATMLGLTVIAPIIPHYIRVLDIGGFGVGVLFAAFALTRIIFTPVVSSWSDQKGRKPYIVGGLLLYSVVTLLYLPVFNFYFLVLVRMLHGFSSTLVVPIALAYAGDLSSPGKEGRVMSVMLMMIFLGAGAGPLMAGFVHHHLGYNAVFLFLAALGFVMFLTAQAALPAATAEKERGKAVISFRELLKKDFLKVLIVWGISVPMGKSMVLVFLPVVGMQLGLTSLQSGTVISVCVFLIAVLQIPVGEYVDRITRFRKVFLQDFGSGFWFRHSNELYPSHLRNIPPYFTVLEYRFPPENGILRPLSPD